MDRYFDYASRLEQTVNTVLRNTWNSTLDTKTNFDLSEFGIL